ncbi:DEKNAAC100345 [Brettanomyces naardenensis]|uniref:DEKNAAC100345 n=1 Tax=Brettanomyces naardenensis TaxID=13370 RepID=A0A448YES9_BRENA|nr:DEKNAAC100345 [Brettanomyces naardenensis]
MSGAQPYDPYNPFSDEAAREAQHAAALGNGGGAVPTTQTSDVSHDKLHNLQNTLDETAGIMRNNLEAINQRGETLDDMDTRANELSNNAKMFNRSANQVRKDMWKKNMKLKLCVALVIVILLIVIIVPIVVHFT